MATLQDVIDLAREPLNDDAATRYPDATILRHVVHGLLGAYRGRPDLFIGQLDSPPSLAMTAGSPFPLPDAYVQVIADYATARCEGKDDEHVNSGRAAAYMNAFGGVVPA